MPEQFAQPGGYLGRVYVTTRAAREYADFMAMDEEAARRDLTILLYEKAHKVEKPLRNGAEQWRARDKTRKVDVSAQVDRQGPLDIITTVNVRTY